MEFFELKFDRSFVGASFLKPTSKGGWDPECDNTTPTDTTSTPKPSTQKRLQMRLVR